LQTVGIALSGAIATVMEVGRLASICVLALHSTSSVGSPSTFMTQRSPIPHSGAMSSLIRHTNSFLKTSRPFETPLDSHRARLDGAERKLEVCVGECRLSAVDDVFQLEADRFRHL